ncbi:MAG: hypothetical protein ACOXZ2_07190 [Sphaerochaetaceae bacterium]|jgi:hypothetical protein|nr:hypothetical protein [Sphaerochaetaceae bacterium]HHU88983.1 hypothetical protein [Spirochaetales bacterium]
MEKQPSKGNFGTIFVTSIITLILLVGVILFTYFYIVPNTPIANLLIYGNVVKFLPIIIAFLILLTLFIAYPPYIPKDTDPEDELELDHYTASLYNLPLEEDYIFIPPPLTPVGAEVATTPFVPPVEVEPAAPVTPVVEELITPVVERPKRVVPTPLKMEVDYTSPAVLFNDYPYPIKADSDIAQLLAPIEATTGELVDSISNTFYERLNSELESALQFDYNLSLARLSRNISTELELRGLTYPADDGTLYVILPFYSRQVSRSFLTTLLHESSAEGLNIGLTSLSGRRVDDNKLLEEVKVAFNLSLERGDYSIISYDDSLVL